MIDAIDRQFSRLDALVARGPAADPVLRVGLGVVILLAGVHKMVVPEAWAPYLAPLFATRWPAGVAETMVFLGLTEPPFAAMLVLDRWTTVAGVVVAVSIAATMLNLGILWVQTGRGMDVLIRDLAVLVLGAGVAIRSARRASDATGVEGAGGTR